MQIRSFIALATLSILASCTSIDCSLDSVVVWTLSFYDSELGEPMKLPCLLSVDAAGAGNLYNRGEDITSMELPMSHGAEADTLYLRWGVDLDPNEDGTPNTYEVMDVLTLAHDNYPHFDAIDCPAAVFHTITDATFTTHPASAFPLVIDSVSIIRPQVDYNDVENIRLYLRIHNAPSATSAGADQISGPSDVCGASDPDR